MKNWIVKSKEMAGGKRSLVTLCGLLFVACMFLHCSSDEPTEPGNGEIVYPEAVGWQTQSPGPTNKTMWAVYFHDENVGTMVGSSGKIFQTFDGGESWIERESNVSELLFAVTFSDSLHGWAVGYEITATSDGGATWTQLPKPDPDSLHLIYDASFPDSLHGWIVGTRGSLFGTDDGGQSWKKYVTGADQYHDDYTSVHFISVAEGWVTGHNGSCFYTSDTGNTWSDRSFGGSLVGSAFFPDGQGWAVDLLSHIAYTPDGGLSWTTQAWGQGGWFRGISMVDTLTGWVVGEFGCIMHTSDGQTWVNQESGTYADLKEVWFVNRDIGWVVGDGGIILKTTDGGATWSSKNRGTMQDLWDIEFVDDHTGWAVGYGGTILHTTNRGWDWVEQESGTDEWLYSIYFIDKSEGWVVGYGGTILHTTNGGNSWEQQSSGTNIALFSVTFVDSYCGWAVGGNGTMVHTMDGGYTWAPQTSNSEYAIWSVFFHDRNRGWIVSDMLQKTTDGGASWQDVTIDGQNWGGSEVRFVNDTLGWLLSGSAVIRTVDGGENWTRSGIPSFPAHFTGHIIDEDEAWVVGDIYVGGTPPFCYRSTDGWQTWEEVPFYHNNSLRGVFFIDRNVGWMVGDNGSIQHTTTGGVVP